MSGFVLRCRRSLVWLWDHFRADWGAPFVLGFMVLLLVAVSLLIVGLPWTAEAVGNIAYFSLVAGVVLQLVCFWKRGDREVGGET